MPVRRPVTGILRLMQSMNRNAHMWTSEETAKQGLRGACIVNRKYRSQQWNWKMCCFYQDWKAWSL